MKKTAFLTLCIMLACAVGAQTPCDTIRHTNLPYVMDFEGQTDSSLFASGCWQRTTFPLDTIISGSSYADVYCNSSAGCNLRLAVDHDQTSGMVAIPPVDDFSDLEITFKCYSFQDCATWVDLICHYGYLWVGVLEDCNDPNTFVGIQDFEIMNAWHTHTVRLNHYHGSGHRIAFRGLKMNLYTDYPATDTDFFYIYVDSIDIHPVTTCGVVEQLNCTNATGTQATITWTDPEWAGNFKIHLTGGGLDTIVTTSTTSVTFTDLVPYTNYTVSVSVLCAAGEGPATQTSFATVNIPVNPTTAQNGSTSVTLRPDLVGKNLTQRVFIPDGHDCIWYYIDHIEVPLMIMEFRAEDTVQTGDDVRSVCVNMEHSFSADVDLAVICPTGQMAILKNGIHGFGPDHGMDITGTGNGVFLGLPLDGTPWDDSDNKCDSLSNPFGVGLDYCFSRSHDYTLVTGEDASEVWSENHPLPSGNFYLSSPTNHADTDLYIYTDTIVASYGTIPNYFQNHTGFTPPDDTLIRVKHPSNHADKSDYYLPVDPFDALVGCPMNGEWKLYVKDGWGIDNGWLFGWGIDLRNPYSCDGMTPDTVIVHDTVVVHDTVFVTVGIENAESIDVKIYAANGQIVVEGKGMLPTVKVYDISGREIAAPSQADNSGERQLFTVPSTGAYMVKVGDNPARKVVVVR